jgi:FAD/FMN-containing dehydrogenase
MMEIRKNLTEIVGKGNVSEAPEKLSAYSKDTSFESPRMPKYVVHVENKEQVQKIIELANKTKVPVYPVSSGIHFYGNTIPLQAGIVMDLSKMNKILNIDERNRFVRMEPGVTWGQLQSELAKHDLMAICPLLPHPQKSALTSHLEREPGCIPKFEYTDNLVTMEVVLPTGELFRTGSACVPGFPDKSFSQGVNISGPGDFMWPRIFQGAQGTLGVATWAQVKIEYRPKVDKTFFIPFEDLNEAVNFVYKIQRRLIGEECLILNSFDLAAILAKKWPEDFTALRKNLAPWTVVYVLGGGKRFPEDKIAYEEEALRETAAECSIPNLPMSVPGMPGIEKQIPDMLRTAWPDNKTFWKFGYKGGCEDLFFRTTMNKAQMFYQVINEVAGKHGYSPNEIGFYVQPMVYGGNCHFEANFYYNPGNEDEVKMLSRFYSEAAEAVISKGGFFSRPYGPLADMVYRRTANYTAMLKKLKNVMDPNNVLSPGRLCF